MPKQRKGRRRWLLGCLLLLSLCVCGSSAASVAYAIPQATARIGPPAEDLDPVQTGLLAGYLLLNADALDAPVGDVGIEVALQVEQGDTALQVLDQLQAAGVIENPLLLRLYMRYRGLDRSIEAGNYQLHGGMSTRELAQSLQRARPDEMTLTVVEGWRLEQIADSLALNGVAIDEQAFLDVVQMHPTGYSFSNELPEAASLEGFLFPDTYRIDPEMTPLTLVERMLKNFEIRVDDTMRGRFLDQGLSLYDAVTLASIVEREAVVDDERALIASVFLNRLELGMNLDADPTVQYALGQQADGSWWKTGLTHQDLQYDSPYNTYLYPGLPPGPIGNPGLQSLRAVAYPEQSDYLFFRAMCDGSGRHAFAETFEQHLNNACP